MVPMIPKTVFGRGKSLVSSSRHCTLARVSGVGWASGGRQLLSKEKAAVVLSMTNADAVSSSPVKAKARLDS